MCSGDHPKNDESISVSIADGDDMATASSSALIDDLVVANRILFAQGVVDAFGHISARHDKRPDRFLLARNMAPACVTAGDIVEFNLEGEPLNSNGRKVYLERFIHSEIYRLYPDVNAVVHSHSPGIVPMSVVKSFPLRPLFHMAGFIGGAAPVFEIRDFVGNSSDLLISSQKLGVALAEMFANSRIVLMRGHGSTVVAPDIKTAVYRAVYAEVNARFQMEAARQGEITFLTPEEAETCMKVIEGQIARPWDLWKEQALGQAGGVRSVE